MTIQKKIIFASVFAVSLAVLSVMVQPQIFAEETEESQYTKANNVAVHTVFTFHDAVEESDGFQVFSQTSGFNRELELPSFKLEGIVDYGRENLYKAADMTYKFGPTNINQDMGEFNVDVYLHTDGTVIRHFQYDDCGVTDYKIVTLFDKEEGWTTSKGFATLDEFEFECNGYKPLNPLYDLVKTNGYHANTENSLDLRDTQTWSDLYK